MCLVGSSRRDRVPAAQGTCIRPPRLSFRQEYGEWLVDNSMPKPPDCEPEGTGPCNSFPDYASTLLAGMLMLFPITSLMQVAWKPDPAAVCVKCRKLFSTDPSPFSAD